MPGHGVEIFREWADIGQCWERIQFLCKLIISRSQRMEDDLKWPPGCNGHQAVTW